MLSRRTIRSQKRVNADDAFFLSSSRRDLDSDTGTHVAGGSFDSAGGRCWLPAWDSAHAPPAAAAAGAGDREWDPGDPQPSALRIFVAGAVAGRTRGAAHDCGVDAVRAAAAGAKHLRRNKWSGRHSA